ncbi:MAG: hypothetical protein GX210_06260 [Firmicutes bacterium]|nr:hypothetical protein [Bacillota bacterium]
MILGRLYVTKQLTIAQCYGAVVDIKTKACLQTVFAFIAVPQKAFAELMHVLKPGG